MKSIFIFLLFSVVSIAADINHTEEFNPRSIEVAEWLSFGHYPDPEIKPYTEEYYQHLLHIIKHLQAFHPHQIKWLNSALETIKKETGSLDKIDHLLCSARNESNTSGSINSKNFALFAQCHNLEALILRLGRNAISCNHDDFEKLKQCCQLKHIDIDEIDMTDDTLLAVVPHLLFLENLCIEGITFGHDKGDSLLKAFENHTHLTKLNLTGKGTLSDGGIKYLPTTLKRLTLMPLTYSGDIAIFDPQKKKSLTFFFASYSPEQSRALPGHYFSTLCELISLTSLHLGGVNLNEEFEHMQKLTNLTELSFSRAHRFNKIGLDFIAKSQNLRLLGLTDVNLTNSMLDALAPLGKNLIGITLNKAPELTDEGIKKLLFFKSLQLIYLYNLPNITNIGVDALEAELPNLTNIGLSNCPNVCVGMNDMNLQTEPG